MCSVDGAQAEPDERLSASWGWCGRPEDPAVDSQCI